MTTPILWRMLFRKLTIEYGLAVELSFSASNVIQAGRCGSKNKPQIQKSDGAVLDDTKAGSGEDLVHVGMPVAVKVDKRTPLSLAGRGKVDGKHTSARLQDSCYFLGALLPSFARQMMKHH